VGRTGRAGHTGRATSIVSGAEMIELSRFEKALKLKIERKFLSENAAANAEAASKPIPITRGLRDSNTLRSRTLTRLPGEIFA
jgi:superfamily II DNA/RNA helicase